MRITNKYKPKSKINKSFRRKKLRNTNKYFRKKKLRNTNKYFRKKEMLRGGTSPRGTNPNNNRNLSVSNIMARLRSYRQLQQARQSSSGHAFPNDRTPIPGYSYPIHYPYPSLPPSETPRLLRPDSPLSDDSSPRPLRSTALPITVASAPRRC